MAKQSSIVFFLISTCTSLALKTQQRVLLNYTPYFSLPDSFTEKDNVSTSNGSVEAPVEQSRPTGKPSDIPSYQPLNYPTTQPSFKLSSVPTDKPSNVPSLKFSNNPSTKSSYIPTAKPFSTSAINSYDVTSSMPTYTDPTNDPTLKVGTFESSIIDTYKNYFSPMMVPSFEPSFLLIGEGLEDAEHTNSNNIFENNNSENSEKYIFEIDSRISIPSFVLEITMEMNKEQYFVSIVENYLLHVFEDLNKDIMSVDLDAKSMKKQQMWEFSGNVTSNVPISSVDEIVVMNLVEESMTQHINILITILTSAGLKVSETVKFYWSSSLEKTQSVSKRSKKLVNALSGIFVALSATSVIIAAYLLFRQKQQQHFIEKESNCTEDDLSYDEEGGVELFVPSLGSFVSEMTDEDEVFSIATTIPRCGATPKADTSSYNLKEYIETEDQLLNKDKEEPPPCHFLSNNLNNTVDKSIDVPFDECSNPQNQIKRKLSSRQKKKT